MKTLKHVLATAAITGPLLLNAQQGNFELKGKIGQKPGAAKIYMIYDNETGRKIDSSNLNDGSFHFAGHVTEPVYATLILDQNNAGLAALSPANTDFKNIYLDSGKIELLSADSVKTAVIKGSILNDEAIEYVSYVNNGTVKLNAWKADLAATSPERQATPAFQEEMKKRASEANEEAITVLQKYIQAHPASYFSLQAIVNMEELSADPNRMSAEFQKITIGWRNTQRGKKIGEEIALLKKTAIGAQAPDFSQPDSSNHSVALSSFKGKYVLIDFWASWCMPCRQENPNLVEAYSKYHSKGLEIFGVSLDDASRRDAWLSAIKQDGLNWTQVSDLKGGSSEVVQLYAVKSIPQNFLLNPDGKIIAKNLRGTDLVKKLKEILGE